MNTPLAYLTYAARALARDEYDDAIVREVFSITAFDRIFAIHGDRAAAVAAMW